MKTLLMSTIFFGLIDNDWLPNFVFSGETENQVI